MTVTNNLYGLQGGQNPGASSLTISKCLHLTEEKKDLHIVIAQNLQMLWEQKLLHLHIKEF